jgi:hypothetical protein
MYQGESTSTPSRPSNPPRRAYRSAAAEAASKPLPERVDWEELGPEFMAAWGYPRGKFQPEHVEILGQNGSGKSWFERHILSERARLRGSHVVIVLTKPADKTLQKMGWPMVSKWPPAQGWTRDKRKYRQVIYWAKAPDLGRESQEKQARSIEHLLESLWKPDSNIIVAFDEIAYVEQELGLRRITTRYFREGRALGITVMATTQRPQGVSRYMHSESAWSVFFAPKDEEDAERMAQVAGYKHYYKRVLQTLDRTKYEFLLVHNLTGESVISSLPKNLPPIRMPRPEQETPKERPVTH